MEAGIVEQPDPGVEDVKKGDRVALAFASCLASAMRDLPRCIQLCRSGERTF